MADLDELIASANKEITDNWEQGCANKRQLGGQTQNTGSRFVWIILIAFFAMICYLFIVPLMPISEKTIMADLNVALDTAQGAIEDFRQQNGKLPSQIPAPAESLMGIVRYQPVTNGYILSISMNGKSLSRHNKGSTVND